MPNYSSLNKKSLVQYATKRTNTSHERSISPGPGEYLNQSNINNLYSPLSTVMNRAPKSQNYFEEVANRTACVPGPGQYTAPETLAVKNPIKKKKKKKKKRQKKVHGSKENKSKSMHGQKTAKQKETIPTLSFSFKSESMPPFVICLAFAKQSLGELRRKVKMKARSMLDDMDEKFEDYCLCDNSGMPLKFMMSTRSVKRGILEDLLHPIHDLGLTNNQILLLMRKKDTLCKWDQGIAREKYIKQFLRRSASASYQ